MSKRPIVVSLTSLLAFITLNTSAQANATIQTPVIQQIITKITTDSLSTTENLLADKVGINEKAKKEKANAEAAYNESLRAEQLEYPAVDLYGENSWSNSVKNPFTAKAPEIPAQYEVDCSGYVSPLDKPIRITSNYGYRRRFRRYHYGLDIGLNRGDTIRAVFDGKVRIKTYQRRGYGHYVVLRHPNGLETVYGHMQRSLVDKDQIVKAGEPIGLGGNTGRSTGPHLHLETRFMGIAINPRDIIDFKTNSPIKDTYVFNKGKAKKATASKSSGKRVKYYRIRKGDTLSHIAKRNRRSVRAICRANGMSSRATLRVGKVLRIP